MAKDTSPAPGTTRRTLRRLRIAAFVAAGVAGLATAGLLAVELIGEPLTSGDLPVASVFGADSRVVLWVALVVLLIASLAAAGLVGLMLRRRDPDAEQQPRFGLWTAVALLVLLAAYFGLLAFSQPRVAGEELRFDTFVDLAERGKVTSARILDQDGFVVGNYLTEDESTATYHTKFAASDANREFLVRVLLENRVPFDIDQQQLKRLVDPMSVLIPTLMLVVVFIYLILSYQRGVGLFAIASGARKVNPEETNVTFDDVGGQDDAIAELREAADFLTEPERFAALGARVPKGVLLYGPPGCGKTLIARALAGQAGANFYSISGSDFVELYVGVGAARVRDLFREARENAPSIVFIDELDAVGQRRRSGMGGGHGSREEQEQALNQILTEMDGFSPMEGIIVVGATNRPDVLDPALLRPGRLDRTIGLDRPDATGREEILAVHAKGKPLAADVDLGKIAHDATGMTGADLASVVNEAALLAGRTGKTQIGQDELEQALTRIREAPERQRRLALRDRSVGAQTLADERVTFDDVAGLDEAIVELAEVRDYITAPERFAEIGAKIPRGLLLVGPPGTGKTLLARAVAGESHAAFISVSASEFVEVFVGEGAARVRDLFAQAKALAPSVLFIDELDAIGARRGVSLDGNREREQTLNQILIELDGFSPRDGVITIAASNRPEILDSALIRPGRFDRVITVGLPDRNGRRAILDVHAADKPLADDVDLDTVAGVTHGMSGADLANVMNEGALLAARGDQRKITMPLLEEAIERVSMGVTQSRAVSEADRRVAAYHEAGHALVGRALPGAKVPHKISIVPRGQSLGGTRHFDQGSGLTRTRSSLLDEMAGLLGGRAAERLATGEPGSGAADDLQRVTRMARWMIRELGMSDALGPVAFNGDGDGGTNRLSEETVRLIDAEVRELVGVAHERATAVLDASRDALDAVVEVLLERETLTAAEITEIAGDPPDVTPKTSKAAGRKKR